MPKYCSVPNCRNDSGSGGERRSFYRFPLQEPARLQQWLSNMGREGWTPSRHQYVCHQHFAASCFRVRWGIRYIEKNAVPTIFQDAEKRKASDCGEQSPKRRRDDSDLSAAAASSDGSLESPATAAPLCEGAADPSRTDHACLLQLGDAADTSLGDAWTDGVQAGVHVPLALFQREEELSNGEEEAETEVVVVSAFPAGDGEEELLNAVILPPGHRLVFGDPTDDAVTLSGAEEAAACGAEELAALQPAQVIAYYKTPADAAQFSLCPQTVLSSALSSTPIASTLPIVSKHVAPPPLVLTVETPDAGGGDEDEDRSEEEDAEPQDQQLEEHCYHRSSLSREQLEAVVCELQRKVKVLQQRHRRHLDKLLGLESCVSQLRQSNLLNEERLQLLERAYIQSSAAMSDAGETVAIIYEEDDGAYLYTPLNGVEAEL